MKMPNSMLKAIRVTFLVAATMTLSHASAKPAAQYLVYVGTYTGAGSQGIYVYRYDAVSGKLDPLGLAAETPNPSFLTISSNGSFLYAVNETGEFKGQKNTGGVTAFRIDHASGKLALLNEQPSGGADPCYLSLEETGKYLLVANYTGGSVAAFPVETDGRLATRSAFIQYSGKGLNPERQEAPHSHWIASAPGNRFVLSADLGLDEVHVYHLDASTGGLTENPPGKLKPGSGPRHIAFSSDGKFVYVLSEISSTLTVFSFDAGSGTLKELQIVSTLPLGFKGANDTAEIQLHPSGKFLYASNRGDDSIVVFHVDSATGKLTFVERASTQGKEPRNFSLDPSGKRLFAANQTTGNIVAFNVNGKTGRLKPQGEVLKISKPVCIVFVPLDGTR